MGLGRVQSSPRMGANGHLVIVYDEGGVCGNRGKQWSTRITFICEHDDSLDASHPLGSPIHISTDLDNCTNDFKFLTVLACNDTMAEEVIEPDSCRIFHSGTQQYIDIRRLVGRNNYHIEDRESHGQRFFEMQPCSKMASCKGAICAVHKDSNSNYSLGILHDFMYEPTLDSVRVAYTGGDVCNILTNKRWASKIYYTCDLDVGIGAPVVRETYDCLVIFDWRTSVFCANGSTHPTPSPPIVPDEPLAPHDLPLTPDSRVQGGISWGQVALVLLLMGAVVFSVILYKKPEARERVIRILQESRARLPVVLGGRGRDDSTLLVSNGRFGSLADDDDFS